MRGEKKSGERVLVKGGVKELGEMKMDVGRE